MPMGKEKSREARILLDFRVHRQMHLQLCAKLADSATCLEAEHTREGDKVILPLVE